MMTSQSENVIIIDNNQSKTNVLTVHLEQLGYTVSAATSGRQALSMVRTQQYKLIFLATGLWGMNSYQIVESIQSDMALRSIPVIMYCSGEQTDIEQFLNLGAMDYLTEPLSVLTVKARVQACLAQAQLKTQETSGIDQEELLKIERDVQIARQIQEGFLPDTLPQPEGWEIAARFHPAREVAGDFYDSFMMTQGRRIGLVIADVCDKGVGAALFMSLSRSLLRAFAQQHYTLSDWTDILTSSGKTSRSRGGRKTMPSIGAAALKNAMVLTNEYITNNHIDMNMFVTLFFGVLDPATGALLYANGGHEPPIIIGPTGEVKARLDTTGPVVGMMPGIDYGLAEAHLDPGDILYCYTDGVTDARSPQKEFFGKQRVQELIQKPAASATELLDRFEYHLQMHIASAVQFDDITMLAVRRAQVEELAS